MGFDKTILSLIGNEDLFESLYEAYQKVPNELDPSWRQFFSQLEQAPLNLEMAVQDDKVMQYFELGSLLMGGDHSQKVKAPPIRSDYGSKDCVNLSSSTAVARLNPAAVALLATIPSDQRIRHLIEAYRRHGHLLAKVNPIATEALNVPPQLSLETLGFTLAELTQLFPSMGLLASPEASLDEIIQALQRIYCGVASVEYVDVQPAELAEWIRSRLEPKGFQGILSLEEKTKILELLNRSQLFESFLHTKYVGQKRFSLEGCETLIPMLGAAIDKGSTLGMEEVVLGMAHRGRLNVLSNILNKSYQEIFSEFDEGYIAESFEGTGDVKYHKGYLSAILSSHGHKIKISLTPNPSHLESVDPVVEGQARGKQFKQDDETERVTVVPILVHGDAALSGQGVVYETLQLCNLPGYRTGGTIHFVINNQIGFTTLPRDSRSTRYSTDIALTFGIPVFHVNAEHPEECVFVTQLAMEIRQKFHCDVFIDINCYRKYGHNEGDEPAFTQPLEYRTIRKKKSIQEIYADSLIDQGVIKKDLAESLENEFKQSLQKALESQKSAGVSEEKGDQKQENSDEKELLAAIPTGVSLHTLAAVTDRFCDIPADFHIHPKVKNLVNERLEMGSGKNGKKIDWGMGEFLAYGTLLWEGTNVRITGQDVCRGTFSHRHAMWVDQESQKEYFPLSHLKNGQGRFEIVNSSLSEMAALGFEYGYSLACVVDLVIWEAQFGDFANGAQVIIDQYLMSGEQKWSQKSRLVLLLPHGYEGQGPEHSSGRIERFLTLAGHHNVFIANPTTPAQLFHLLRRQVLLPLQKPLIVFTPKGLLRYPACVSSLEDLAEGSFHEIIDDSAAPPEVERLILCSGRVYYDLVLEREKFKKNLAIVRIEQLYPLHQEKLKTIFDKYSGVKECCWVQEEPKNMGAWQFIKPYLEELLTPTAQLRYIGRGQSASPATGSHLMHEREHQAIMQDALG
jgi:2-oxoglutarate dehydrogenase E1 component